jgi:DNA-binding transcriptional ArsR family regulator
MVNTTKRGQQQRRKTLRPHPTRDQIVDAMRAYDQPISPTRLAEVTGHTLGAVAYHVRTLLAAGIVELSKEGRVRGAVEHFYALAPGDESDLSDPLVNLQKLCGVLTLPTADGGYPKPIELDDEARAALQKLLDTLRPKVQRVIRETAKRAAG